MTISCHLFQIIIASLLLMLHLNKTYSFRSHSFHMELWKDWTKISSVYPKMNGNKSLNIHIRILGLIIWGSQRRPEVTYQGIGGLIRGILENIFPVFVSILLPYLVNKNIRYPGTCEFLTHMKLFQHKYILNYINI